MYKKLLNLITVIILSIILVSCKTDDPNIFEEDTFVKTSFINKSKEYEIKDSEIDLLFLKETNLPLVNVKDYLTTLDGVYLSNEFEFVLEGNILNINVSIEYDDIVYEETLKLDSRKDIIDVSSLDFFDLYMEQPETNYSENLISLPAVVLEGNAVQFELSKYDFDIIQEEDNFYLPLVIANLIFNQSNYFDTYYNGDVIYGIDTSMLDEKGIKDILKSPLNNSDMPEDLKIHDYNFNKFIIDYFYGLKEDRNIKDTNFFVNKDSFIKDSNKAIFDTNFKLDDLHSSHMTRGYYNNKRLNTSYNAPANGPIIASFYSDLYKVQQEAVKHFGVKNNYIDFKTHEYIDNKKTLIIYVLEFTVNTPVEIEDILKDIDSETTNIIIDLSFNTGGNLGAVLRMFALMTNNDIKYHFNNPLNNEKVTYSVKGEREAYENYNYYIKTSSVTFSAANLAASIAKEQGIEVIGRNSSGGASSISFFVFPTGSITIMSSNSVLTNYKYESIEKGIEVDHYLSSLYNENEIINILNSR